MSFRRLEEIVGSFESIAFSSGLFVAVLVACGKAPAPVQLPVPASAPLVSTQTAPAAIQGNWLTSRQIFDWGSDVYTYKFGTVIPNKPTTLIIQRTCNLYSYSQPLTSEISVPVEIIPQNQPGGITPSMILRILSSASASKTHSGFNCAVSITPNNFPYIITGNRLLFHPNTPSALTLTKTL